MTTAIAMPNLESFFCETNLQYLLIKNALASILEKNEKNS
jgi:hypothetical protein